MTTYIQSLGRQVWMVVESPLGFEIDKETGPTADQIIKLDLDAKANNALFSGLGVDAFERASNLGTAHDIWKTLIEIHEGTDVIKDPNTANIDLAADKSSPTLLGQHGCILSAAPSTKLKPGQGSRAVGLCRRPM